MNFKFNYYWLLVLFPMAFLWWFLLSTSENKPLRVLPYYGPKNVIGTNDTAYHLVPVFEFVDQDQQKTNLSTVKGKIYVAEFFFTTCKSICPIMNTNLQKVYTAFKNDTSVLILSHTVDPETDSVATLKNYAAGRGVNDKRWLFLTGAKPDLYSIARKGYLLNAEEGDGGEEDFIHTQNFALIDKERHIRGFYDGTDMPDIDRLIRDITLLKKEHAYLEKHTH